MLQTPIQGTPEAVQKPASHPDDSASLLHGASSVTVDLQRRLRSLAPYFRTALITGETGVGKRRAARELHRLSHPDGPFIVYRPGLPQLTGLARSGDRANDQVWPDLLQSAAGGTLVVEEVGDLSTSDQARLLYVLREPGWTNAGASRTQVIGTSRHEARMLVSTGRLRQDLYAMFLAVEIRLQPLRNRPEDVEELAVDLLAEAAAEFGIREPQISPEALDMLQNRPWPGNVAELRSVLREAVRDGCDSLLTAADLKPTPPRRRDAAPERTSMRLQDAIDAHVCKVLTVCGGNKLKSAELLGVSRSTLYRMLESLPSERGNAAEDGSGSLRP